MRVRCWIQIEENYHEAKVIIQLALLSQGLIKPQDKSIPGLPVVHIPVDLNIDNIDF